MSPRTIAVFCILIFLPLTSQADDTWPRFRGPNGTGVAESATIPASWTPSDYRWSTELPGLGHSSPVVWKSRLFVMSAIDEGAERVVLGIDTDDGKIAWRQSYPASTHPKHGRNSFASTTPAVDAERVYVMWASPTESVVVALTHEGSEVWRRQLTDFQGGHGFAASPIIYRDLLIVQHDHEGDASLLALDATTGTTRWETPRSNDKVAYSTPCVYETSDGAEELIFNSGTQGISSVDPRTGEMLWQIDVFDKRSVSSPVFAGGHLYGSCGSGAGGNYVVAVQPGDARRGLPASEAYRIDQSAPYVPTPVALGDLLFLWSDNGVVTCARASSGDVVWRKRVGGDYSTSPVIAGQHLYGISDDGEVVVLAASEEYEILGRVELGEECRSTPAVAGGTMYLRTVSHLYALEGSE